MEYEMWMIVVGVGLVTLVLGFMLGRIFSGNKSRMVELQMELDRAQTELTDYKQDVEAHFDKTASLFVSMAGSYKDLFDHLSSGSERISAGPARKRFRERVDAMLLGEGADTKQLTSGVAAAAVTGAALAEADDAEEVDALAADAKASVAEPADDATDVAQAPEAPDAPEPMGEVAERAADEAPAAGAAEGAEEAATATLPEADAENAASDVESDAERQKPS
ncbi:YhcB family protein [Denitromonas ohlonensis]|jgi:uncharacterized membrane-anchored protein YhcB (DUF1043 family)|uniref:Z-ring associated protein G n=2 Tax=Denitromonas TaxID=139331 RepID=A0A558E449_9RHOO|nr:DUF1043 family protein [Denitromonas ohlonensis]TVT47249.1 MAG: DUF1043 family protein [Denitromonas halophila]TVO67916.1 DUF1043 family protein [Denitromonas ohlonensis]TVO78179.1 DUF1043 family protein [Denitromonas ohlonensis]TVT68131.1 MAG: DUF1043 family protein [Denitromonas halophila]TVT75439.1 MAG: DUF1043 family protein [Denitromonas halophila]